MVARPTVLDPIVGYSILFIVIISFTIFALAVTFIKFRANVKNPTEEILSARNTARWWAIAASFFASSMGTWVLESPAEVGSLVGWFGVIGYALASSVPWVVFAFVGPKLKSITHNQGFTVVDYLKK